ncbi:MAG TPA: hypothetical protein DHV36_20270 [Desulfobacteraceae bacterium]|nr:hypothetical protein [Desulfobacteraceae bacterium]
MEKPALEFIEEPYSQNEVKDMMAEFRDKGYVILPDVLKRETVDPFREQLENSLINRGMGYTIPHESPHYIHCTYAPRGRQVLPDALSHSQAKPKPCLHTTIVVIQKDGDASYIPEWHKDREPDGMPGNDYHYPMDVFLAFYFEDITDEHGPTLVMPGSHRDVSMTPFCEELPVDTIYCRKQDALLIDQRTWHRGTPRTAEGTRFLIVYGIYALPFYYGHQAHMPVSQRNAWIHATNSNDRVFFGGPFAPPDRQAWNEIGKELDEKEKSDAPLVTYARSNY